MTQTKICGCMATRHSLIGSCTECGRIVCEEENLSLCPFCSSIINPPLSAEDALSNGFDASTVQAYRLKDKLLQFDKENAKRTQVHDSQADYYESSTWLSAEEKAAVDKKNLERKELVDKLNKPTNMFSLNLTSGDLVNEKLVLSTIPDTTSSTIDSINTTTATETIEYTIPQISSQTISCRIDTNQLKPSSSSFSSSSTTMYTQFTSSEHDKNTIQHKDDIIGDDDDDNRKEHNDHQISIENIELMENQGKIGTIYRELQSHRAKGAKGNQKVYSKKSNKSKIRIQHDINEII